MSSIAPPERLTLYWADLLELGAVAEVTEINVDDKTKTKIKEAWSDLKDSCDNTFKLCGCKKGCKTITVYPADYDGRIYKTCHAKRHADQEKKKKRARESTEAYSVADQPSAMPGTGAGSARDAYEEFNERRRKQYAVLTPFFKHGLKDLFDAERKHSERVKEKEASVMCLQQAFQHEATAGPALDKVSEKLARAKKKLSRATTDLDAALCRMDTTGKLPSSSDEEEEPTSYFGSLMRTVSGVAGRVGKVANALWGTSAPQKKKKKKKKRHSSSGGSSTFTHSPPPSQAISTSTAETKEMESNDDSDDADDEDEGDDDVDETTLSLHQSSSPPRLSSSSFSSTSSSSSSASLVVSERCGRYRKFDPKTLGEEPFNALVIGATNTGKTFATTRFLFELKQMGRTFPGGVYLFSKTAFVQKGSWTCIPEDNKFDGIKGNEDELDALYEQAVDEDASMLIVFDDVTPEIKPAKKKDIDLAGWFQTNRHLNLNLIVLAHKVKDLPTGMRSNVNGIVVICGKPQTLGEKKCILEEMLGADKSAATKAVDKIFGTRYNIIVKSTAAAGASSDPLDFIFWWRAQTTPEFTLAENGESGFQSISEMATALPTTGSVLGDEKMFEEPNGQLTRYVFTRVGWVKKVGVVAVSGGAGARPDACRYSKLNRTGFDSAYISKGRRVMYFGQPAIVTDNSEIREGFRFYTIRVDGEERPRNGVERDELEVVKKKKVRRRRNPPNRIAMPVRPSSDSDDSDDSIDDSIDESSDVEKKKKKRKRDESSNRKKKTAKRTKKKKQSYPSSESSGCEPGEKVDDYSSTLKYLETLSLKSLKLKCALMGLDARSKRTTVLVYRILGKEFPDQRPRRF